MKNDKIEVLSMVKTYIVGCWGVLQLGFPAPGFGRGAPAKVGACKSIIFTESSFIIKGWEKGDH